MCVFMWGENHKQMLLNVHAQSWKSGLVPKKFEDHSKCNADGMKRLVGLAKDYNNRVQEEAVSSASEMMIANVGKIDPKRYVGYYYIVGARLEKT